MFLHRQLKEVEQWNREVDGLDLLAISYQIHSTGDNIIYSLTHSLVPDSVIVLCNVTIWSVVCAYYVSSI